jgi:hypothetical protein
VAEPAFELPVMAGYALDNGGFHEPSPFVSLHCTCVRGLGKKYGGSAIDRSAEWTVRRIKTMRFDGCRYLVAAALVTAIGSCVPLSAMAVFSALAGALAVTAICKRFYFAGVIALGMTALSVTYLAETAQRLNIYK